VLRELAAGWPDSPVAEPASGAVAPAEAAQAIAPAAPVSGKGRPSSC
jgi:hypothetical protein